jgi:hypothetical protein
MLQTLASALMWQLAAGKKHPLGGFPEYPDERKSPTKNGVQEESL